MKLLFKIVLGLVVGGAIVGGLWAVGQHWRARLQPKYREADVKRGSVVSTVNSTGAVQPVVSVSVGSFVSGPIEDVLVDFNDTVAAGQVLARIDPRLFEAAVARDRAVLATRRAEVERAKALAQQARNDEARAVALRKENATFVSDTEMDQFKFNRQSLDAQLVVAEAAVKQAAASLETSEANLAYTEIKSPVNGTIIHRKIDKGQTLAAQFQTPEMFIVAPDMKSKMHVLATVDEADIGLIREAQKRGLPVKFTVDAYPDDLFEGTIFQVRMNSTTTQNVVTYPVIVAAPNPDLKLMPGMTASLSFQVAEAKDTLCVPNTALRFYPLPQMVRPEDRGLIDGTAREADREESDAARRSATDKADVRRKRNRRHVWVQEGPLLRAIEVTIGVSDSKWTQILSGDLKDGQKLVVGLQTPE